MGRASPRQEPVKGISEGGKSIPVVEKELSMFVSRPVWLEPREGCWLGACGERGGEHWTDRRGGGRPEPDRQGLVLSFPVSVWALVSHQTAFRRGLWPALFIKDPLWWGMSQRSAHLILLCFVLDSPPLPEYPLQPKRTLSALAACLFSQSSVLEPSLSRAEMDFLLASPHQELV